MLTQFAECLGVIADATVRRRQLAEQNVGPDMYSVWIDILARLEANPVLMYSEGFFAEVRRHLSKRVTGPVDKAMDGWAAYTIVLAVVHAAFNVALALKGWEEKQQSPTRGPVIERIVAAAAAAAHTLTLDEAQRLARIWSGEVQS